MSTEAMKLALEALEMWCPMTATYLNTRDKAITALQEALAQPQPQQEPVAWMCHPYGDAEVEYGPHNQCENCIPLYTSPPARKPLMAEEIRAIVREVDKEEGGIIHFARAIEAAHGIKEST